MTRQLRIRPGVSLSTLKVGDLFYPPRVTTKNIERWRVWGPGREGGVCVQEWILVHRNKRRRFEWGPAVEWTGTVLVEPVKRKGRHRGPTP